jgi:hypothetical protein
MSDETIQTLHRRIAQMELEIARLKRHNAELRSAIEALMAPAPSNQLVNNPDNSRGKLPQGPG